MLGSWDKELFEGNLEGWASTGQMIVVKPNLNRLVRIAVIESTSDCYFRCSKWYTWQHQVCFLSSLTNPIFDDARWSSTVINKCYRSGGRNGRPAWEQVPWEDLFPCFLLIILVRYQWFGQWYQKEGRTTLWNVEGWKDDLPEPVVIEYWVLSAEPSSSPVGNCSKRKENMSQFLVTQSKLWPR